MPALNDGENVSQLVVVVAVVLAAVAVVLLMKVASECLIFLFVGILFSPAHAAASRNKL